MPICLGVPKEIEQDERRVALVPAVAERFKKMGVELVLESGAGSGSYYPDKAYTSATIVNSAEELYQRSDVILKIQPPTEAEIEKMKETAVVVGIMQPYRYPERVRKMRDRRIISFAMELVPRISRAQSMDVLSSQASIAGYKAVLMAANRFGGFFPMLTTAAGTIRPAKVLVIGAGVAGLQAIAIARKLGAVVEVFDVRSAVKEQVESLGGKFVEVEGAIEDDAACGHAIEQDQDFQKKQKQLNGVK